MRHLATLEFWERYRALPDAVRAVADKNFALLKSSPRHPSLQLKKVGRFWACRVGLQYRALGVDVPDGVLWFWIGSHAEYDRLIGGFRRRSGAFVFAWKTAEGQPFHLGSRREPRSGRCYRVCRGPECSRMASIFSRLAASKCDATHAA